MGEEPASKEAKGSASEAPYTEISPLTRLIDQNASPNSNVTHKAAGADGTAN